MFLAVFFNLSVLKNIHKIQKIEFSFGECFFSTKCQIGEPLSS